MEKNTIALFLADEANDHQKMVCDDAKAAAERAGLQLADYSADGRVTTQVKQIYRCIHGEDSARTLAIVAMPVRDNALNRVAHDAVNAGLGWVCLHRQMDCLDDLRHQFPGLPICTLTPDQREIGRIQGRQFRALLPGGGRVLYVQGNAATRSACERLEGMREAVSGTKIEAADVLDGNWTASDAERMVAGWLRMVMSGKSKLDLIGCQNDRMATGARKALDEVASLLKRPDLKDVMLTGCDGLAHVGQKEVDEGLMAATVIIPSTGAPAVELIVNALRGRLPPPVVTLQPVSYPAEAALVARPKTTR